MTNEELDQLEALGRKLVFSGLRRDELQNVAAALPALLARARRANELEAEIKKAKAEGLREAARITRERNMPMLAEALLTKADEVERE